MKYKCTRCKELLIEEKNIYKNWHIPICERCRTKILNNFDMELTKEEKEIANKRYGKEVFR